MAYRFHWVYYKRDVSFILKISVHSILIIVSFVIIKFIENIYM